MKKLLCLLMALVFITGCGKSQTMQLTYDESIGYNLYDYLGYTRDDVLKIDYQERH